MTTTAELLSHLRKQNITVWAHNGSLVLNGPKGVVTSALRAELMERKAEILTFLSSAASSVRSMESRLRPVSRDRNLPLSLSQQRLWFLDQYEPNSAVYNVCSAQRVKGELDVGALERSLKEIVRRHEALRTTFSMVEAEPVQIISPSLSLSLAVVDLTEHPESKRESEAQRLAAEENRKPFDLARGPLFRTTLIKIGEDDHILLLAMHHIVSDGWSMGVLYHELSVLYGAFTQGQPPPLAELPIQYADYAVWQRERLEGEVLESQLSYWRKQLKGVPGVLHLSTDRPRPPVQSFRGARQSIELSRELAERLKALSRKEGVTLYMTLLAAFQTLLHRYTAQDDIVVGSPIANRNQTEIEGLIGFFVNTLVLRTDFSGNPSFRELLHRVRETALGAYAHQDLPFEKLVEELQPERSLSYAPLFQAMFVLQNTPSRHWSLSDLTSTPVQLDANTAKFDVSLSLTEHADGIKGLLEYSTDLFDKATIIRMSGHFRMLLEGIVTNPDHSVSDLPILTEPEKHQLLIEWNDTAGEYPSDKCIHQLFEEQVEKTPNAIAVVFEDKKLTYRDLNQRANRLAHYLKKLGVGAEARVGICVERSLETIVGVLGILKAGAAYVPLDPCYPKERLAFMLEDTQAPVLLTQERILEKLPIHHANGVCLDADWEQIAKESNENLDSGATAKNLAYVIYTSGSTGRPKGVQVLHHAVINVLTHVRKALGLTAQDIVPLVANTCFDISVMELFLPLIAGARLVVASSQVAVDGARIEEMLSEYRVTLMHATPATWRLLLQAGWNGVANMAILAGGETLQSELADQLVTRGSSVWNLYGPTETTIYSSAAAYAPGSNDGRVSIGRAIANTEIYILDDHLQPLPIGAPGQLHIGGDGLARGYLNRPDLTAEKFIPNPFSNKPGTRLYQTGDLARYLPDGNVEFLGRLDHQIKLRGFRIELGEIESVLGEHSKVHQSVLIAREDLPGDKRLVAYVVPNRGHAATVNELRSFLKEKLPEYMLPSAFVFLDAMPLTSNTKLDRKALPAPDQSSRGWGAGYVAPRNPVEETIAAIWATILKIDKVGIHDNFFDLGGHSLLATQVVSRVRAAFQLELPLRTLFENQSVEEFARAMSEIQAKKASAGILLDLLGDIESLSDEEAQRLLVGANRRRGAKDGHE